MIEYVIEHNPDDRILAKASQLLDRGEIICFPTDTNWILAASAGQKAAIEKLYKIKQEGSQKHFSVLCNDISKASEFALIDNQAFKILKKLTPGHYTFIFEATKKTAKLIQASKTDREIGIRFVPSTLVNKLIEVHGEVLVSTNIPKASLHIAEDSYDPIYSYQIEEYLGHLIALIIDPGEFEFLGPSTIVSFIENPNGEVIRVGAGDPDFFA